MSKNADKAATDAEKDFTYLVGKPPSELHEALASFILERTGVEVSPKDVQLTLGLHHTFQRGEANKKRAGYRGLAPEISEARSTYMVVAGSEAKAAIARREASEAKAPAKVAKAPAPAKAS